jgi:hypothetical protein
MKKLVTVAAIAMASISSMALADSLVSPAPEGAKSYIITPQDGAIVTSPVLVQFGLSGMGVAPAGVEKDKTGHHHLLINADTSALDFTMPLPSNDEVKHFGGGQTETTLTLEPGIYTLQLLLGNYAHVPHDQPVLSDVVTITVE